MAERSSAIKAEIVCRREGKSYNSTGYQNRSDAFCQAAMISRYSDAQVELWYLYDHLEVGNMGRKMVARWGVV